MNREHRDQVPGPYLHVDLTAVAANTALFAARTPGALMAVVKADGFGHGAVGVARTALANGASWLGVTTIEEGLELRGRGLTAPTLSWLNPLDADYGAAIAAGIDLAVPSLEHLEAIIRSGLGARLHLQLDTGMARDGAPPQDWAALCGAAREAEGAGRARVLGVMSHLACAGVHDDPVNVASRAAFDWGVAVAREAGLDPPLRHLAATAAILTDPASLHTMVRVGAGLVGIDPSGTTTLSPAMTLTAPVISVRRVPPGTCVGYGHTWSTDRATTLALLPLGYADGLPRAASGRAQVSLRGIRFPIVGRISMDQVVVDTGEHPIRAGEVATVFGPGQSGEPTVADWARWADTIEHEIVTGMGSRIRRTVSGAGSAAAPESVPARTKSVAATR
ncbi:MAG: alanine racemase [Sporichthyaceae bacterium]